MNSLQKVKKLTCINPYSYIDKYQKNKNQMKSRNLSFNSSKKISKDKNIKNMKLIDNDNSVLNKTTTIFRKQNLFNKILSSETNIDNIIKCLEKELILMNSEKYINDIVKMFEIFQEELIIQLENKYNDLNFFFFFNKYTECINLIKTKLNCITKREKINKSIINNYTNNNNNIIIFEENIKKYFLNQEENIVN